MAHVSASDKRFTLSVDSVPIHDAADPRMGESGDENDLKYYSPDQVHTSAEGAKVLAEIVAKAIQDL